MKYEIIHRCGCNTCNAPVQIKRLSDSQLITVYDKVQSGDEIVDVHQIIEQGDNLFVAEYENENSLEGAKNVYTADTLVLLEKGQHAILIENDRLAQSN